MVLPLVPLVLIGTGVLTGGTGATSGLIGMNKMRQAQSAAKAAQARYDLELARTQAHVDLVNARLRKYGERQEEVALSVLARMVDFLRRHAQQVEQSPHAFLDGADARQDGALTAFGGVLENPLDLVGGVALAGATGAATMTGIPAAVTALGTASTGAAINGLSGAAAHSATMAWLGGGSIASSGGGVALGVSALNFVTVGPTLLVTGLVLNGKGEKALTKSKEFCAQVDVAASEQAAFRSLLSTIEVRVSELTTVLDDLESRAVAALDELEREEFDRDLHTVELSNALRLAFAVRDVLTTPVLDESGALSTGSSRIILTYRSEQ